MRLLDRYLLRDLVRTFLICTGILVTIIAFGAAIKPLANGQFLSAVQAAKYMGLAIVPMMQFALPFSAGFAATVTLHRMSIDNEVQAMATSGVGYARMLRPVSWFGIVLLVLMVALTQWIIPNFWGLMKQVIATDVAQIFQASISRGEPFQVENLLIYADDMVIKELPEDTDADTRMILVGFVAAELDDQSRIETEVTARQAVVDVYRRGGQTYLQLAMLDTVVFDSRTMQLSRTERVVPETAWTASRLLEDEPLTMTQWRLLELRRNPDDFSAVTEAREELAKVLRNHTAMREISRRLAEDGAIELVEQDSEPRRYVVRADGIRARVFYRRGGPVVVTAYDGDEPILRFRPERIELERSGTRLREARFSLFLESYSVSDLVTDATNRRSQLSLPGLLLPDLPPDDDLRASSAALLAQASLLRDTPAIRYRVDWLQRRIGELQSDIMGHLHKRYALCLTAPLLLLLGSTLAMWLRGSLPLTIYCWAFMPSILDLILISGGEQMIRDGKPLGVLVLWSGNAMMVAILAFAFSRLAKN